MRDALSTWLARAVEDEILGWHARGLALRLCLTCDDITAGLLLAAEPRLLTEAELTEPDIAITGGAAAFAQVLRADPPPGAQSFGALLRHDTGLHIKAKPLAQAQALAALERLVELARPEQPYARPPAFDHAPEAVTGHRRVIRTAAGRGALIHWLEAGDGPPLVFLHTAGADARQYLHQMADRVLQTRYRMIAFDLPWHGQSSGAFSGESAVEVTANYRLTEAAYLDWTCAALEQIAGAPAIVVGCSMGAGMALTVTARRPDLVRGCIALEAPLRAPGRRSEALTDARIADSQHNPAYVRALLGPGSPQQHRDEACGIYAQARPGVYMGDLAYYSDEYDGAALARDLRAGGRPVALLTGSYDYSASPANTRALVDELDSPTVRFAEMPGLGHFPMIEDPSAFRPYLLDALDQMEEAP